MKLSDLHPYDGRERVYKHTDLLPNKGRSIAALLLGLEQFPSDSGEVQYELSIYSGGIGVFDQLAISLPASPAIWQSVAAHLSARQVPDSCEDPDWEDLIWLISSSESVEDAQEAAAAFVNSERRAFQAECGSRDRLLFGEGSNVNDWTCIWGKDGSLNYLGFSQG